MHGGGSVDVEGGGGEDFDWLEERFEGPDFDDDVFENVDDGVSGSVVAPHRPSEGDTPANNDPYRPTKGDTLANNDPPL